MVERSRKKLRGTLTRSRLGESLGPGGNDPSLTEVGNRTLLLILRFAPENDAGKLDELEEDAESKTGGPVGMLGGK